jgi:tyrosine aminotransferase
MGIPSARKAVAQYQTRITNRIITADQVCLTNGCSGALEIAIKTLCSEGDNILLPRPGFPLYETIARSNGIEVRTYDLLSEKEWEADIQSIKSQIDSKTCAILVNNPSNPCGSVFSEAHICEILSVAAIHHVPIIADEIYGDMVFKGTRYVSFASLSSTVPILEVGGISKLFLVPGFRIGWVIVHDAPACHRSVEHTNGSGKNQEKQRTAFELVRLGVETMSHILVGPNTIVQAALPLVLNPVPESNDALELTNFRQSTIVELERNVEYLISRLRKIPGVHVVQPHGAMYVMVGIRDPLPLDDSEFSKRLLEEELVFVLPGTAFGMKNFVRLVTCAPLAVLEDACNRIEFFCERLLSIK